jgi:hypothetical protein
MTSVDTELVLVALGAMLSPTTLFRSVLALVVGERPMRTGLSSLDALQIRPMRKRGAVLLWRSQSSRSDRLPCSNPRARGASLRD